MVGTALTAKIRGLFVTDQAAAGIALLFKTLSQLVQQSGIVRKFRRFFEIAELFEELFKVFDVFGFFARLLSLFGERGDDGFKKGYDRLIYI